MLVDRFQEVIHTDGISDAKEFIRAIQDFLDKCSNCERIASNRSLNLALDSFRQRSNDYIKMLQASLIVEKQIEKDRTKKKTIKKVFVESIQKVEADYICSYCQEEGKVRRFEQLKSYQRHVRKDHVGRDKIKAEDYEEKDKVTCLLEKKSNNKKLCGSEVSKVAFTRHLKEVHQQERPDKKQIFRGFFTIDEGKSHSVCWALPNEIIPKEQIIEVEDDVEEVEGDGNEVKAGDNDDKSVQNVEIEKSESVLDVKKSNYSRNDIRKYLVPLPRSPKIVTEEPEHIEKVLVSVTDLNSGYNQGDRGVLTLSEPPVQLPTSQHINDEQVRMEEPEQIEEVLVPVTDFSRLTEPPVDDFCLMETDDFQMVDHEEIVVNSTFGEIDSQPEHLSPGSSQHSAATIYESLESCIFSYKMDDVIVNELDKKQNLYYVTLSNKKFAGLSIKTYDQSVEEGFVKVEEFVNDELDELEDEAVEDTSYPDPDQTVQKEMYQRRNILPATVDLSELEENRLFIEEFMDWTLEWKQG